MKEDGLALRAFDDDYKNVGSSDENSIEIHPQREAHEKREWKIPQN